jgi:hypothetical protein
VQCPICTQALEGGELVMVCTACHQTLGGGLSVGATGEFIVPSMEQLEAHAAAEDHPRAADRCAWCGKQEAQVKKLLGRSGTALCNECVSLACDIFEAELGGDWR